MANKGGTNFKRITVEHISSYYYLPVLHIIIRDSNSDRKCISFDEQRVSQIPLMYSKNGQTSDICQATWVVRDEASLPYKYSNW